MDINSITERFDMVAQKYDSQRRVFIPCFEDFYGTSISFLSTIKKNFQNILDLGAGTGLLTKYLYDAFPLSNFTMVDISEQMLHVAKVRFEGLPNFNYLIYDYSKTLPSGSFDLVCSALSIHHLEENDKQELFRKIYNQLPNGGIFINLDIFNASSEFINSKFQDFWHNYIIRNMPFENSDNNWQQRRELDKENTIVESTNLLKIAGFKNIDCIYNYMKFGVLIAIK